MFFGDEKLANTFCGFLFFVAALGATFNYMGRENTISWLLPGVLAVLLALITAAGMHADEQDHAFLRISLVLAGGALAGMGLSLGRQDLVPLTPILALATSFFMVVTAITYEPQIAHKREQVIWSWMWTILMLFSTFILGLPNLWSAIGGAFMGSVATYIFMYQVLKGEQIAHNETNIRANVHRTQLVLGILALMLAIPIAAGAEQYIMYTGCATISLIIMALVDLMTCSKERIKGTTIGTGIILLTAILLQTAYQWPIWLLIYAGAIAAAPLVLGIYRWKNDEALS